MSGRCAAGLATWLFVRKGLIDDAVFPDNC